MADFGGEIAPTLHIHQIANQRAGADNRVPNGTLHSNVVPNPQQQQLQQRHKESLAQRGATAAAADPPTKPHPVRDLEKRLLGASGGSPSDYAF